MCIAALATDHCLEALLAVTAAGGIAAPLNWRWGAAEAAGAVQLVGARLLAADAGCLPFALAAAAAAPRGALARLLLLGPPSSFSQADLAAAQGLGLTPAFAEVLVGDCGGAGLALRCAPGGAALIVYTSGATGRRGQGCWVLRQARTCAQAGSRISCLPQFRVACIELLACSLALSGGAPPSCRRCL